MENEHPIEYSRMPEDRKQNGDESVSDGAARPD
jgi:hypothetical protein